jgi:hypothetical protein
MEALYFSENVGMIIEPRILGLSRGRQRWIRTSLRTVIRARRRDE